MPKTLKYRPLLIDKLITNDRMSSYSNVFNPKNDIELMGVYLWNSFMCGQLQPLLCASEVVLRNSIDHALVNDLGRFWWSTGTLTYKSFIPHGPVPDSVKKLRENFARATSTHKRELTEKFGPGTPPLHQGVIAKTDFSTWEYILDEEFLGPNLIWPKNMSHVFSGPWPSTKAKRTLRHAKSLVKLIRDFRNRISHHEPAWKKYGVLNEHDAIHHLKEKIAKIEELLNIIHPESTKLLDKNGIISNAKRACTSECINKFKHTIDHKNIKSITKLARIVDECCDKNISSKIKIYSSKNKYIMLNPI